MMKNCLFSVISTMKPFNNTKQRSISAHKLTCFGCINIRTAVVVVGLWHLAVHLLGFCLFVSAYYLVSDYCSTSFYGIKEPSTVDQVNPNYVLGENFLSTENTFSVKTWSFMSLFSFFATVLLICGVSKKISALILPFLLIQVFDILFDLFIIMTYVLLSSSIEEFFSQLRHPPFQRLLSRRGFQNKRLNAMIFIAVSFTLKTYLMRIVYLYFEYLSHLKENGNKAKELLYKHEKKVKSSNSTLELVQS